MRDNDIVFLNVHRRYLDDRPTYGGFLGIYALAAFVNANGYRGQAFAGTLHQGKGLLDILCRAHQVQMVGLYCDYGNVTENIALCRYLKETYGLPVIVGGPQATSFSRAFFEQSRCDAVVRYEGELTVVALLDHFLDGGTGALADIRGIAYLADDGIKITPPRPLIENLDRLPFVDDDCYLVRKQRPRELSIMTGRGCPFHCAFCHEGTGSSHVRFRSVENVLAEIEQFLASRPDGEVDHILFVDDTFTLRTDRVHALCEGLRRLRAHHDFDWFCEGHVHTLLHHPQMIEDIAAAGAERIQLGIESGNQHVLDAYGKQTTPEEIKTVVRLCRDAGIQQIYGNLILGSAFFSEETYARDLAFGKELQALGQGTLELGVVSYWPLPETAMTQQPEAYGIMVTDFDFTTSVDDFPQTEADGIDRFRVVAMIQELQQALAEERREMLAAGDVPLARICSWFDRKRSFRSYGAWWYSLKELPHLFASVHLLADGEAVQRAALGDAWPDARPMRVVALRDHLQMHADGTAELCGVQLSRQELAVLIRSTGRLTCREIVARLPADGVELSLPALRDILDVLEKRYLMVYAAE